MNSKGYTLWISSPKELQKKEQNEETIGAAVEPGSTVGCWWCLPCLTRWCKPCTEALQKWTAAQVDVLGPGQ